MRTDSSNAFAHATVSTRLPAIIDETIRENPALPEGAPDALRRLRDALLGDAPLELFDPPAPDYDEWRRRFRRHRGSRWQHAEWFFAEHLFYRHVITAVRFWELGIDPFAPIKEADYRKPELPGLIEGAADAGAPRGGGSPAAEAAVARALLASLWGNRADLSYKSVAALGIDTAQSRDLIVDDRARAGEVLLTGSGPIHLVTDNAGTELVMDLVLVDVLIALCRAPLFLDVKAHPTYVSDVTAPDVLSLIAALSAGRLGAPGRALGERLDAALRAGLLRLAPDRFWNSPAWLGELPLRLALPFAQARLVILKGDVNYRRLVRDTAWPPSTPLEKAVGPLWRLPPRGGGSAGASDGSLPAAHRAARGLRGASGAPRRRAYPPILALRSLKSDAIAGIPAALAARLVREDPEWRVNGRRGIAQLYVP